MIRGDPTAVKGDRALRPGDEDRLGFREVAKTIATCLVDHASGGGLVVGVEGAWGSGKSSLLFLVEDELKDLPEDQQPTIINFRPWLVGNRDALLSNLFALLSKEIDRIALRAGDASGASATKAREAAEALRKFAAGVGKAGALVEFAGDATTFIPLQWIGRFLKALGEFAKDKSADEPLDVLKEKLVRSLRELSHRFVITIDDVDRLEPAEVIEVLRLARSVADFPNVIYLLCYDSKILAHSIRKATKVESGSAYLEKIVQLTVMVPRPEPFQLRQWFGEDLHKIASVKNDDELARLKAVLDHEGGQQLETPRAVVRALDAIRFIWPPLRDAKADLADLVWLQLIKNGNPKLYRWIEDYCGIAAMLSLGTARVENAEKAKSLAALLDAVPAGHFDDPSYRNQFADQLPGLEVGFLNNSWNFKPYERVTENTRDKSIEEARLASPDHYRLYFALSGPSHALTQGDLGAVRRASEGTANDTARAILDLHAKNASGSLSKAEVLLERVKGGLSSILTSAQCKNLLIAFSNSMDAAHRIRPFDAFWFDTIWDRAERIVRQLLSRLEPQDRQATIETMFRDGQAIGWLTALFRHETFAHGRYGNQVREPDERIFTGLELDGIIQIMLTRYRAMSPAEVFSVVAPLTLLFAWRQGGDEQGPRDLVARMIETDQGLVEALGRLTSLVDSSSRGRYSVLTRNNLEPFLDFEEARARINALQQTQAEGLSADNINALARAFADSDEG